jgi:hypothetical protein
MIHALDHIVLAANAPDAAVADYEMLLGRRADRSTVSGSPARACFQLANMRLDLAAATAGAAEGLCALVFAVADVDKARHLLERRALRLTKADASDVPHIAAEASRWCSARARQACSRRRLPAPIVGDRRAGRGVAGLDHVVIRSPNPDPRLVALRRSPGPQPASRPLEPAWARGSSSSVAA